MFGQHFYNKHIRNTVIAFGTVFNNVNIKRLDSSGNPLQNIRVPLAYAPKEKMLVRLEQQEDLRGDDSKVAVTLPRMSFDIQSFAYDPSRKLNKNLKFGKVKASGDTKKLNTQYAPVPYDIGFNLYAFVANSDDGLQILEQILPYFQPDYTVTMIESTTMGVNRDIPFILESVDYEDTYTGNFDNRRAIIYTLKFTAKVYLYGPIGSSSVVRKVGVDLYENVASTNPSRKERITITPNPTSADFDDDYTFTTTTEFFDDGKNYDEVTGDDK